jgi:hypothetical protein
VSGYIAFGNDELDASPPLHSGEAILCPHCGRDHIVVGGIDTKTERETETLLFYQCGDKTYLAGIDSKNVMRRFMKEG